MAMLAPATPKSWYLPSKPHKFCPGCGHGITLKALGEAIDELGIYSEQAADKGIFFPEGYKLMEFFIKG
jgi:pyruvate/2-oxoacid:ferredoxin oxidoreductase beta subunit